MEISVIIPVFNRLTELRRALESLKNQTFKDFEVVVIDDGSDIDLSIIVNEYKELKIKYKRINHSGNIAFLRNEGVQLSQGMYIAVLDSDDYCEPNRLMKQISFMKSNDSTDVLASWVNIIGDIPEKVYNLDKLYNKKRTQDEIISECLNFACCICNSSVLMKRTFYKSMGGYDNRYIICEDSELWMRAFAKGKKFYILEEKLITRTVHKDSITETYWGNPIAITNVIRIKLNYLITKGLLLNKKIGIIGKNSRNNYVLQLFKEIGIENFEYSIIDFYNEKLDLLSFDYYLITEYDPNKIFYSSFIKANKKLITEFIYL